LKSSRRNDVTRITVDLSEKAYDRLGRIQSKIEAESKSEVLRKSLQLLEFIVNGIENGDRFEVRRRDGTVEPLAFYDLS